jgi:hypothetical protein
MKLPLRCSKRPLWIIMSQRTSYSTAWVNVCCPPEWLGFADESSPAPVIAHRSHVALITTLLAKVAELTEAVQEELRGLPEPSAYAHHETWGVWQRKDTAILNLRPPENEGLPIEILHPAFATFVHDVKTMQSDKWTLEDDANQVSLALCSVMAYDFPDDAARRTALAYQLNRLDLALQLEYHIPHTIPIEIHSVRPDLGLQDRGMTVLLGVVKGEIGTGDAYMQASRSYQALVNSLVGRKQASDGVPCILLVVHGLWSASQ